MEELNLENLSLDEAVREMKGSKAVCCCCGATVGKFTYTGENDENGDGKYKCQPCRGGVRDPNTAKSTFPFVAEHLIPGQKVEVQSMRHLRSIERERGVQSVAYNQDSKNFER